MTSGSPQKMPATINDEPKSTAAGLRSRTESVDNPYAKTIATESTNNILVMWTSAKTQCQLVSRLSSYERKVKRMRNVVNVSRAMRRTRRACSVWFALSALTPTLVPRFPEPPRSKNR